MAGGFVVVSALQTVQPSGLRLYGVLIDSEGRAWDGAAFETVSPAEWPRYAIPFCETAGTGIYSAEVPSGVTEEGFYTLAIYLRLGATPSAGDYAADSIPFSWTGESIAHSGSARLDLSQPVPTSNAPQTSGDALNAARATGFGSWRVEGRELLLFAADGATIVRRFQLDDAYYPTRRK